MCRVINKSQFWAENLIDFEAEIIVQEVMFQGPGSKRT
jgi:hypothetical protein